MKTQFKKKVKEFSKLMLIALLFINYSCTNNGTNNEKAKTQGPTVDIHTAAYMGNVEAIKQHIEVDTDLNAKDQYGSTPLTIAATFGRTAVANSLIEGGADLETPNAEGSTPLHVAAFFCRTEIVKSLLAKGVDKTIKNANGATAIETVTGPFEQVKGVYEYFNKELGPLGLRLDYAKLEKTRPEIAALLQ